MDRSRWTLIAALALFALAACTGPPSSSAEPTRTTAAQAADNLAEPTATVTMATTKAAAKAAGNLSDPLVMVTGRAAHTATLLPDGRVLIAGGFRQEGTAEVPIAGAEIYDPATNRFTAIRDMNDARSTHTATLLATGEVLIAGGWGVDGRLATAELFDPETGAFRYAASLGAPRASMTATPLGNGQVLIAGGDTDGGESQLTAELYDPQSDTFTPSSRLTQGRSAHTATRLADGRVLLVGGRSSDYEVLASAELFDPATGAFGRTGELVSERHKHAAVLLWDGRVLVIGGSSADDWSGQYRSAEFYDPDSGSFSPAADLNSERFKLSDAAAVLGDGTVLVGGGNRQIELYDPRTDQFVGGGKLDDDYYFAVVTVLANGQALISGGYDAGIRPSNKAWIYDHS